MDGIKKRDFFKKFHSERITVREDNLRLLRDFKATDEGKNLETYLKDKAWEADLEGETRVYLVKDDNDSIALFFSLKCGLLYKKYQYDELDEEKKEFVDLLIAAMQKGDYELLAEYYESGLCDEKEMKQLIEIAYNRLELKVEEKQLQDGGYTLKVEECYSAIEIQHFCKNSLYKKNECIGISLGFGIFWEIIVPLLCEITEKVGCKYIYLFAADQTDDDEVRKLVQYYKNELKFSDVEDMIIIKPYYDTDCFGLVQDVPKLKKHREAVWEEFSDV